MYNVIVTTLEIVYSSNNRWALLLCQVMVAWYRYRGKNCFWLHHYRCRHKELYTVQVTSLPLLRHKNLYWLFHFYH
jgi:hypothetical protein